jgi:intracellular septation protein
MEKKKKFNGFFLISFLPAILYWYLEANFPVKTALIGGIALSVAEILFEKIYIGHVHQLSKFNFFLIVALGGFSLMEEDGVWFKFQPALSLWAVAAYMFLKILKGGSFIREMMAEAKPEAPMPPEIIFKSMERNMVILFLVYGLWMAWLAIWGTTSMWVFSKTGGFFIVLALFLPIQFLANRKILKKEQLKKNISESEI